MLKLLLLLLQQQLLLVTLRERGRFLVSLHLGLFYVIPTSYCLSSLVCIFIAAAVAVVVVAAAVPLLLLLRVPSHGASLGEADEQQGSSRKGNGCPCICFCLFLASILSSFISLLLPMLLSPPAACFVWP